MRYLFFLAALSQFLQDNHSQSQDDRAERVAEWEKRGIREDRLSPDSKDFLPQKDYILPYQLPKEKQCSGLASPTYAKATCTSYPGKVVCQLGRYTFVINNGEHKMDPEVIERFAAMVYHRTQEGDANFDVAVDTPYKEQCYCPESPVESTTTRVKELQRSPVVIECSPVKDDRKVYSPSEVIYSCKRREVGIGKRMVISVDGQGTVSDGQLVLPYLSSIEKRVKRQKTTTFKPWEIAHRTQNPEVRNFTDICSTSGLKWCANKNDDIKRNQACQTEGCVTKGQECTPKVNSNSRGKRNPDSEKQSVLHFGRPSWIERSPRMINSIKQVVNSIRKRKRQDNGLCTTTCPPSSTTCPTAPTTCGSAPDLPKDVPCCQSVPPKPPCCPPQTEAPSCPPQKRKRRALRAHARKRKKPPHQT